MSIYERTFKLSASALSGEPSFPVGIIGGAVVFSMEQVILDLDIAASQQNLLKEIGENQFEESLELIREKGIGGLFIDTDHTAKNFREYLTMPKVLKSIKNTNVTEALRNDPVQLAHQKCLAILESVKPYEVDEDSQKLLIKWLKLQPKNLLLLRGRWNKSGR